MAYRGVEWGFSERSRLSLSDTCLLVGLADSLAQLSLVHVVGRGVIKEVRLIFLENTLSWDWPQLFSVAKVPEVPAWTPFCTSQGDVCVSDFHYPDTCGKLPNPSLKYAVFRPHPSVTCRYDIFLGGPSYTIVDIACVAYPILSMFVHPIGMHDVDGCSRTRAS